MPIQNESEKILDKTSAWPDGQKRRRGNEAKEAGDRRGRYSIQPIQCADNGRRKCAMAGALTGISAW